MNAAETRSIALCIQKHIVLVGPTAALSCARRIPGLTIADNGDVLGAARDPHALYAALENAYGAFAGEASRAIMRTLAQKHPPLP